jgi:S1-C subfamily serine protease
MEVPVERGLLVVRAAQDSKLRSGTERVRVGHLLVPIGGDIIIAVDETKMETARDLIVYLETQTEVGQTVQVQVIRDGREQTVAVRLRELTQ